MAVFHGNSSGLNSFTVYGNGFQNFPTQGISVTSFGNNPKIALGSASLDREVNGFTGSIDEIVFWDRELNETEITELYATYTTA